jgi:hypothetical protein
MECDSGFSEGAACLEWPGSIQPYRSFMMCFIRRLIMALSAAQQAFLDSLAGIKQKVETGDNDFSETEKVVVKDFITGHFLISK